MAIEQLIGHVGRILIVDAEQANATLIRNYLKQQNQHDVEVFTDGEEAWAAMKARPFDFVIMGWRLGNLSGIAFLNRIRRYSATLPLLVTSGMINRSDFRLLGDFSCTKLLESPFTRVQFEKATELLIKEKLWYRTNSQVVEGIISASTGDLNQLEIDVKKLISGSTNPVPLALLAARTAQASGKLRLAKKLLTALLNKSPASPIAVMEMAKLLCRERDYSQALDILRRAIDLSPHNMERVCLMGEASLGLRDARGARIYFDQALEMDKEDPVSEAGIVISKNMLDFPAAAASVRVGGSFSLLLNSIGIALVRDGLVAKGVEQYKAALHFVQDDVDIAKVAFNLGLAYLRWGKKSESLTWFEKSLQHTGTPLPKSGNYIYLLMQSLTPAVAKATPGRKNGSVDLAVVQTNELMERLVPRQATTTASRTCGKMLKSSLDAITELEAEGLEEVA